MKAKKRFLYCFLMLLNTILSNSQNIENQYKHALKVNTALAWNELANTLFIKNIEPELLQEASHKAMALAKADNDTAQWSKAMLYAADSIFKNGDLKRYKEEVRKILPLLESTGQYTIMEMALNNIGTASGLQEELDSLYFYAHQAIAINKKYHGNAQQLTSLYQNLTYYFSKKNNEDSLMYYNHCTIEACKIAKDTVRLANSYIQMATSYMKMQQYPQAVECFNLCLDLYDRMEEKKSKINIYTALASMYHRWQKMDKALYFGRKALQEEDNTTDRTTYGILLSNVGLYLGSNRQYRAAIDTLKLSLPYVKSSRYFYGSTLLDLACCYQHIGDIDSCNHYLNKLEQSDETKTFTQSYLFYSGKIGVFIAQNRWKEAVKYAKKLIEAEEKKGKMFTEAMPDTYINIADAMELGANDLATALKYRKKAAALQDSIYQKQSIQQMAKFYAKFDSAEKDLKIAAMEIERQREMHHRSVILYLSAIIFVIMVMIILYSNLQKARKEREAIRLKSEIKEKEDAYRLMKTEAHNRTLKSYFNGLEAGRKKLAKELHDNIANELFGVNLMLKMQGGVKDEVLKQIDNLYKEIRAVSHDLMPPVFSEALFTEILTDHVMRLNMKSDTCFELYTSNEDELNNLPEEVSLATYRIIQESTGNIVKYAKALSASICLKSENNKVYLSVEDNGTGFDTNVQKNGIGLHTMKERVHGLNGNIKIESSKGNGCRIDIEIPLS